MDLLELQTRLKNSGRDPGPLDGLWGARTRAAILTALEDGPDTKLTSADLAAAAGRLGIDVPSMIAVDQVEANGAGFQNGFPKILPELHRFSKATKGRFDKTHPAISYPVWGSRPYPKTQEGRYDVLIQMVRLDVDAGFGSASYGRFQIMGENHRMCGYGSAFEFAVAMARDEATQLQAFERFLIAKGLQAPLARHDWATFARGYNGTGYKKNAYDVKLAAAYRAAGGR